MTKLKTITAGLFVILAMPTVIIGILLNEFSILLLGGLLCLAAALLDGVHQTKVTK